MLVHVGVIRLTLPLAVARSLGFDARVVVVAGMSLQQLAELFSNCRCNPDIALHRINPAAHAITRPPPCSVVLGVTGDDLGHVWWMGGGGV